MSTSASRKHAFETAEAKPSALTVEPENIPTALALRDRWVAWRWWRRHGRWTKVPLAPGTLKPARTNDPATWGRFEDALHGTRVRCGDGVGFVFAAGDRLFGVDVDDCRDPDTGHLTADGQRWVDLLASYAEVSPTGTGVKVFLAGDLPPDCPKKAAGVEVYAAGRYFTVTGRRLPGPRDVCPASAEAVAALAGRGGSRRSDKPEAPAKDSVPSLALQACRTAAGADGAWEQDLQRELDAYCRRRDEARAAPEPPPAGPQYVLPPQVKRPAPVRLLRLWAGDWTGYPSQSEADLALLGHLARYCDADPATLDRWFRVSGLIRPKWDEVHDAAGATYGEMCIRTTVGNAVPPTELLTALASQVSPAAVEWLVPGFIAFGALTVLDGDPGLGKSTLACDLAARLSAGRPLPGRADPLPPAAALLASCEDSAAHTIVPRLAAASADRDKVRLLLEAKDGSGAVRSLQLPDDLKLIEARLAEDRARLLVIDPLMAFLGRDRHGKAIDAHRDQSIRVLMGAFKELAERTGAAVVVVRHLNKAAGGAAVYRGGGSIGITGSARGVLLVGRHPHDPERRVLAVVKSNLGPLPPSRAFALAGDGVPVVRWCEDCEITADDLLAAPAASPGAATDRVAAADWLADRLSDGPKPAGELIAEAAASGWTERVLERARRRLGVTTSKVRGGWVWRLAAGE